MVETAFVLVLLFRRADYIVSHPSCSTDPLIDNYYKRFVRDFMHYNDRIFCAAGKIVRSIQQEAMELGFTLDDEGGGGYSSLHVRRNDLQYQDALINEDKW